jgi:multiple antibiotic resistance protein
MSLESVFLCFVPLLVASDPMGAVPVYMTLTEGLSLEERGRVTRQSLVTAAVVGAVFLFGGRPLFNLLNITVEDFKIAGGLVLLVLAILELVREGDSVSFGGLPAAAEVRPGTKLPPPFASGLAGGRPQGGRPQGGHPTRREPTARLERAMVGVVPLGVPLISGPAVLTTLVMLKDQQGVAPTGLAFLVIVGIVGLAFSYAHALLRVLGPAGTKGLSKVTALILAAIAVMMIRVGIEGLAARLP